MKAIAVLTEAINQVRDENDYFTPMQLYQKLDKMGYKIVKKETDTILWTEDKVIDFVNWHLKLHKLPFDFTLENRTIIESFKNGDKPSDWHEKKNKELENRKLAFGDICRATCTAIGRYIGDGKMLYISAMDNSLNTCDVDYHADWNNDYKLPLPSDRQLSKYQDLPF